MLILKGRFLGDTPPRVFWCKSLDLLENKGVKVSRNDEEYKEFVVD